MKAIIYFIALCCEKFFIFFCAFTPQNSELDKFILNKVTSLLICSMHLIEQPAVKCIHSQRNKLNSFCTWFLLSLISFHVNYFFFFAY